MFSSPMVGIMNLKQHPIYDYLLISDCGKVFSTRSNRFLKFKPQGRGYCSLSTDPNGWKYPAINLKVHRLVAQTFIPNPENKKQVNHKDGNKSNNSVSNLEWVTSQENSDHAVANGLMKPAKQRKGLDSPKCKFREDDLKTILNLYRNGLTLREIGSKFNVSKTCISKWLKVLQSV